MPPELPRVLNVLLLAPFTEPEIERIRDVAPERLNLIAARAGLEMAEELVRTAHIAYMATPLQKDLPSRAPELIWGHFNFAGVSNLRGSEWWQSPLILTSSRGHNHPLPLAESVLGAIFMFARGLDIAVRHSEAHDYGSEAYRGLRLVAGKTLGIVGLGGIGSHLARIAAGCGMRVVASRRSAEQRQEGVEGVDVLHPPSQLHDLLAESDFVAVCAMWTPETEGMFDRAAFAAMKPGAFLFNVARGELIDEAALIEALRSGRLAGAFLDVWHDSFSRPPRPELQAAPNVIFTPHTSNIADSNQAFSLDLFVDNLERLLKSEPLVNVIDWKRGY